MILPTWNQFLIERNGAFSYSCLLCNIHGTLKNQIIKWSHANINQKELYEDEKGYGYENEPHITVLYGLHSNNAKDFRTFFKEQKPIKASLGKISCFYNTKYDVVKLSIDSPDLHELNDKVKSRFKYTSDFPDYQPHCTLAYLNRGHGKKYEGKRPFAGKTVTFREITFSPSLGSKTNFSLR